ncbi:MAG: MlaC/ttg2D family ABC transporter substrate-binding protein [Candidatus Electronema sp. V4]|uniref:MlaC/ttg2D family ABC transporter substrate-binding protein n=1 Tax=Candidatus Electronema sp. V4 TaxID=3454756 RepID=UPI00405559B5
MNTALRSLLFLLLLAAGSAFAAVQPNPTEQVRPFIERVVAQLKAPDFKKDTVDNRIDRIVALVSEHFDFQEMSKRVVGRPWQNMPQAQREDFAARFAKLLGHVYIGKVDAYVEMKIEFGKEQLKNDRAEVKTMFVDSAKSIPVSYVMILKDGKWMAYDVFVEGISLVRNYMEQFKGIPQEQLVPTLDKKLNELKAGAK